MTRTQSNCERDAAARLIEAEFRREIAPLIEALGKHMEAQNAVLLSMHPGANMTPERAEQGEWS